ncbi:hemerythrin domain-containing protein [Vibrio metschnikovii]|uniref:hemerythrin domain-containing protein n=1 Tax=Vibrio metschnikovii TaxID=28172 RepID=UPI00130210DA|nr:hemerythrin domain-containing protein [Vibrio metschnikovii]EKO3791244.1 hemerythrin domain-containing protein [Vibrio metschnikovii]
MMLERIRREHEYMARLLTILREKLQLLNSEQLINYSLIKEIVDYLGSHSQSVHHPKENVLYHYYQQNYPTTTMVENLEQEHELLAEQTQAFLLIVEMILQDAVVPQDVFIEKLTDFIEQQQRHLELEEQSVFPLIEDAFSISDWQQVESIWSGHEDDPVFGETIADRFTQLARRVRKSESECI